VNIMIEARNLAGQAMTQMTAEELRRVRRMATERWKDNIRLNDVA
jgi:hypothetical protein